MNRATLKATLLLDLLLVIFDAKNPNIYVFLMMVSELQFLFQKRFSQTCHLGDDGQPFCGSCRHGYTGNNCER